jgi:hypothetical protein
MLNNFNIHAFLGTKIIGPGKPDSNLEITLYLLFPSV